MTKLKMAVVGAGVGRLHLAGFKALSNIVDVVALCDMNELRLNELADQYGIPLRFTDYEKLFSSGEVEAVTIALPNNLHAPASVAGLQAGLHVLCEKPLAESVNSGQKIVEAADNAAGKFMMCFNRRYRPDVQWIKQAITHGDLGRIYHVQANWTRETGIPGWGGWFTNKTVSGGGPLVDLGVHILDMVMWLLDYPDLLTISADVQANFGPQGLKTWHRFNETMLDYQVEDSATAFVRLDGGISFATEISWASHARPGMDDIYVNIQGTRGSVELDIKNYASEDTLTFYTELNGAPVTVRPKLVGEKTDHYYAMAEFVRCIQNDSPSPAPAEHGLVIMQMIEAIYKSAETRREVVME